METAVVLRGQAHVRQCLGIGTSVDAEWLALIDAARIAREAGLTDMLFLGDCVTVVAQASGIAKCRGHYVAHREAFLALLPPGTRFRIRYIRRAQNLAGIALARLHAR